MIFQFSKQEYNELKRLNSLPDGKVIFYVCETEQAKQKFLRSKERLNEVSILIEDPEAFMD